MAVDAGTIYSEVRIDLKNLKGDVQQVNSKIDGLAKTNKTKSDQVKKKWSDAFAAIKTGGTRAFKAVGSAVNSAVKSLKGINSKIVGVAAFAALSAAVKSSVTAFTGFEQELANVQSVARSTPAEFKKLKQAALDAGESTRFTSQKAAEAMYNLASAAF